MRLQVSILQLKSWSANLCVPSCHRIFPVFCGRSSRRQRRLRLNWTQDRGARPARRYNSSHRRGAESSARRPPVGPSRPSGQPIGALSDGRSVSSWRHQSSAGYLVYTRRNLEPSPFTRKASLSLFQPKLRRRSCSSLQKPAALSALCAPQYVASLELSFVPLRIFSKPASIGNAWKNIWSQCAKPIPPIPNS